MRTQHIRFPVRVMRSLVATTLPAMRTRVTPARARVSTCAQGVTPRRRSTCA